MNKINAIVIFSLLVTSCVTTKNTSSPFVGTWEANYGGCIETWIADDNGIRKCYSGEEETVNKFVVTKISEGLYKIVDTRISSNFKADCSGEISKTPLGHVIKCKLKFSGNDTLVMCFPKRCFEEIPYIRKK